MRTHKAMYQALLITGCMLILSSLNAKTVALWKLDTEPTDTAFNTRCMIDPANDLTINGDYQKGSAAGEWKIPPNPDVTSNMLDDVVNRNSVVLIPNGSSPYTSLQSDTFGSKVNITNDFTVEGWLYRTANPGTWQYVVGTHDNGAGRWILSLRNVSGLKWIFYCASQINDVAFPVSEDSSTTNIWRHIALTYDHNAGSSQQGVWELFIDSQSYGTLTNANPVSSLTTSDNIFYLGGRAPAKNMATEALDYWRVSDTVLATNEFLNAGTVAPETETIPRTIAYWKMNGDTNGVMNTKDFIGESPLYGNMDFPDYSTLIKPAAIHAFEEQPANSTVTLPDGNKGSVYGQAAGAMLRTPDLGYQLEITNNFTVEGWVLPQRSEYDADIQYIANTRISGNGWAFGFKTFSDSTRKLVIYTEDDTSPLAFDIPISGDLSDWSSWKHLALVYDASAGILTQGVWSCYLEGDFQGCVTNSRPVEGSSSSEYFHLGGRVGNGYTFCGYMDCWRASKAALSPNQFLNATDSPAPATDVLALWPINSDGVYLDATDIVGNYDFNTPVTSTHMVTAGSDPSVTNIPNPDATEDFRGDPSTTEGSIVFNTPAAGAPSAYLSTTDIDVRSILCLTNSFTFEGWLKRTKNPGGWQLLFAAGTTPSTSGGGVSLNFTYRTNGYVLFVSPAGINDVAFGFDDDDKVNTWYHVALVYDVTVGKGTWYLYVDGNLEGSIENSNVPSSTGYSAVYIGGRPWSNNSFIGAMHSLRLTKTTLETNEFLNAVTTAPTPVEPKTAAYWKLDSDGTTLNASSQVEPRFSFIADANSPTGTTEQFKALVPIQDTSENFIGDPKANSGAALFESEYLHVQNLGNRVDLNEPFTVEGWMYWNDEETTAVQTITGTQFDTDFGWLLTLNKHGSAATFGLFAEMPEQTTIVDKEFDYEASGLADGWHHLALTYTPRLNDNGTWELFVDGETVDTLVNRFYPTAPRQSHWLLLGGVSGGSNGFDGMLDCWRVTSGVLTTEEFMYLGYERGTFILVR